VSKQSLLLVDGDTRSMRVLEVSLRKAGFTVTTAVSVRDALDKLELHAPDLIISETTFTDGDGFELRRRVRSRSEWDEIPFIFLTAEAAIENKIRGLELGVDDYLTKPIYIKEIVTRINILLQKRQRVRFEERRDGRTRFAGRVADMPVVDVIQTIEISRKSGVIQFVGERNRQAAIYFREGRVIDAEAGALQGEDAVYRLLTWSEGDFEVVFRTVRRREVIATSSQGLLMEGMRRLDEWSRLLEQLPPLTHRFEVDAAELSSRLGDVPDDNNPILRLIDGKRTLLEVIDSSDVGDLECLQAISRLYFEEMLIDLDHGAPVRHTTGKPAPLVEVEAPTPIEEVASGPIEMIARPDTGGPRAATEPGTPKAVARSGEGGPPDVSRETNGTPRAAVPTGSPASPPHPDGQLAPTMTMDAVADPRDSAPHPDGQLAPTMMRDAVADPRDSAEEIDADQIEGEQLEAEEAEVEDEAPGELLGGYRPSSLRLIDEAVAAAQAIEPSLFEPDADHEAVPDELDDDIEEIADANVELVMSVPRSIDDEPSPPRRVTAADALALGREDSGLRMIGSLGRDRAEASGEVRLPGPAGQPMMPDGTQRELITILPRRITREMQAVSPPDDVELEGSTSKPIEPPRSLPPPPIRRTLTGSGVRRETGPGRGAIALLALAGVLGVIAIYLYATRPSKHRRTTDAGVTGPIITPIHDAGEAPTDVDVVLADAPVDIAVAQLDAEVADASAIDVPNPDDPVVRAKEFYDQAYTALEESNFDKALELVEKSLAFRHTARSYLLRARALERLGRIDQALASLDSAEKTYPIPAIYELRARILKAAGRNTQAREAIMKYLDMVPDRGATVKLFKQWLEEMH